MGSRGDTGGQDGGGSRESNKKARQDTEVSAYEREIEKQKADKKAQKEAFSKFDKSNTNPNEDASKKTKSVKTSTNDGSDGVVKQETKNKFTDLTKENLNPSDDTEAKADLFKEQGAINFDNETAKPLAVSVFGDAFKAGSRYTRDYFKNEVLGKGAYTGTSLEDFESKSLTEQESIYQDYIQGRSAGTKDAYGREITSTGGDNKTSTVKSVEQPKVKSQMDNTEVKSTLITADKTAPTSVELNQEEDALKTKKRGRKNTILTSVTGDTSPLTLSKRTLLGG